MKFRHVVVILLLLSVVLVSGCCCCAYPGSVHRIPYYRALLPEQTPDTNTGAGVTVIAPDGR